MFMIPYGRRLETIDEQLAKLIAERLEISKGTNGYPTKELLDKWCETFQVDRHIIGQVFAAMNNPRRTPRLPASPQNLRDIIPVMKQVTVDEVTYQITRMEQYVDFSLVYVEVYTSEDADTAELNVQLMLNVEPNEGRQVQFHRSHGQTNQASMVYMVTPQLPYDITNFSFQLVPNPMPRHPRAPEKILDQTVAFGE
ncbi:chorismate mutase [Alicyclobacillus tolerans]|uniref:chorismate mutase n=1 Tax=Alicyclobacillus tolerans TaxID=90970 RepID=UPI001F397838|nr:chorismate mutase [Alicyclobacillus tolerans]MCF8564643.1 chorismate mutase [Alicyclobacillus tolerans]